MIYDFKTAYILEQKALSVNLMSIDSLFCLKLYIQIFNCLSVGGNKTLSWSNFVTH
jgi:hypothetical protein